MKELLENLERDQSVLQEKEERDQLKLVMLQKEDLQEKEEKDLQEVDVTKNLK